MAVLADVHGNIHALDAVLAAVGRERVDLVVCLGDLVGYNANPSECIAGIRASADVVIAGNHDRDTSESEPAPGTSPEARMSQEWTRERLSPDERGYLKVLPHRALEPGGFIAFHGCFLNEGSLTGYVTSTMLAANLQAVAVRNEWPALAFCGHTHAPLCGWLDGETVGESRLLEPVFWPPSASAVLINPGSVGQPRDRDPRAAFAVVDASLRRVEVKRIEYDVEGAARAVLDAGLPESFARRLSEGR
jgi:predicted phosphodiesterase